MKEKETILKKKYLEMKQNYEDGVKKYDNLDKIFFEYKQEREKEDQLMLKK